MSKIIMRNQQSKAGLQKMIDYINTITPTKLMTMVEVGVFHGDGTIIFAKNFLTVCAVDPWLSGLGDITDRVDMQEVYECFFEKAYKRNNISIYRMKSKEASTHFQDGERDLVYIDAGHEYEQVADDLKNWLSKVKKGGWITGHDYRSKFPGVIKAVNELVGKPDKVFPDTSWVKRI